MPKSQGKSQLVQVTPTSPAWLKIINTEESSMSNLWRSKQGSRPYRALEEFVLEPNGHGKPSWAGL